mmetsp:Transcript_27420/g.89748  ORF Transcript_27420/g.89748 Transcript_27420/m.89748 type:complete len:1115 (+) Transcript_27420:85-3429(+)
MALFQHDYQQAAFFEVFSPQGKNPTTNWKMCGGKAVKRVYDKSAKGNVYNIAGGPGTKMSLPKDERKSMVLLQPFLVLQFMVPIGSSISFELGISDMSSTRRRLYFSTSFSEIKRTPLHCQIPLGMLPRGVWLNLAVHVADLVACNFQQSFRSLELIALGAVCKLRKIFTVKQAPPESLLIEGASPMEEGAAAFAGLSSYGEPLHRTVDFPPGVEGVTQVLDSERVVLSSSSRDGAVGPGMDWRPFSEPTPAASGSAGADVSGDLRGIHGARALSSTNRDYEGPMHLAFGSRFPVKTPTSADSSPPSAGPSGRRVLRPLTGVIEPQLSPLNGKTGHDSRSSGLPSNPSSPSFRRAPSSAASDFADPHALSLIGHGNGASAPAEGGAASGTTSPPYHRSLGATSSARGGRAPKVRGLPGETRLRSSSMESVSTSGSGAVAAGGPAAGANGAAVANGDLAASGAGGGAGSAAASPAAAQQSNNSNGSRRPSRLPSLGIGAVGEDGNGGAGALVSSSISISGVHSRAEQEALADSSILGASFFASQQHRNRSSRYGNGAGDADSLDGGDSDDLPLIAHASHNKSPASVATTSAAAATAAAASTAPGRPPRRQLYVSTDHHAQNLGSIESTSPTKAKGGFRSNGHASHSAAGAAATMGDHWQSVYTDESFAAGSPTGQAVARPGVYFSSRDGAGDSSPALAVPQQSPMGRSPLRSAASPMRPDGYPAVGHSGSFSSGALTSGNNNSSNVYRDDPEDDEEGGMCQGSPPSSPQLRPQRHPRLSVSPPFSPVSHSPPAGVPGNLAEALAANDSVYPSPYAASSDAADSSDAERLHAYYGAGDADDVRASVVSSEYLRASHRSTGDHAADADDEAEDEQEERERERMEGGEENGETVAAAQRLQYSRHAAVAVDGVGFRSGQIQAESSFPSSTSPSKHRPQQQYGGMGADSDDEDVPQDHLLATFHGGAPMHHSPAIAALRREDGVDEHTGERHAEAAAIAAEAVRRNMETQLKLNTTAPPHPNHDFYPAEDTDRPCSKASMLSGAQYPRDSLCDPLGRAFTPPVIAASRVGECDSPTFRTVRDAATEEPEDEHIDVLYDAVLGLYFDPRTGRYFELAVES